MPTDATLITVGITTRNRPESLQRCLQSLTLLNDVIGEVIVVDDTSDPPIGQSLGPVPGALAAKLRIVEQLKHEGYIVARNTVVRQARFEHVFLLDDDAFVIDADAVRRALALMTQNASVGAVACAQAEADGSPWPPAMQPSPVDYVCYVCSFIGFAHIVRRSVFLQLGGYRESFYFYAEEKEFCLRLLSAGYHVVYLPDARIAHVPDSSGRSPSRYLRHVVRNDCLGALYNEPLPMLIVSLPIRFARYLRMRRAGGVERGGLRWIVGELVTKLPSVWVDRKPLPWASFRRWRQLRREKPAFSPRPATS